MTKKAITLTIIHLGILASLVPCIGFSFILFRSPSPLNKELLAFASASGMTAILLIFIFGKMTCSRKNVKEILRSVGVNNVVDNVKVGRGYRVLDGQWNGMFIRVRSSKPYSDFWPSNMPPIGPDGDVVPSGAQFLNVKNKLRDGGITIAYGDVKCRADESVALPRETVIVQKEFGSWMSRGMVESIIRDAFRIADSRKK